MRSQSHCLSVIHHQYLVCKLDGGSSLGNNKYGFISLQITQCAPQARIGGKIQCRCTVIENQNLRIFYNGTGNRQTLLLSAGEISSALFNHIIQTALFCIYHIRCLGHFNRMPQLFLCRIRISPAQILCNRSLKQYGFLHDNTNALSQLRKRILSHIGSRNFYTSLGYIVKTRDQVDHRTFTGTGSTDNPDCLSFFHFQINICKRILRISRIFHGNMGKFHLQFTGCAFLCLCGRIRNRRYYLKHLLNTVSTGNRLIDGNDQICKFYQLHQYL